MTCELSIYKNGMFTVLLMLTLDSYYPITFEIFVSFVVWIISLLPNDGWHDAVNNLIDKKHIEAWLNHFHISNSVYWIFYFILLIFL